MPRLRLLGGALLERDGEPVEGPAARRHPLALLAMLAAAPARASSRSKLAGHLWPESTEEAARNRLNTCVYNVRRAVGADALITRGDDLGLAADVLESDLYEFRGARAEGDHARAVELYAGPFLDGFFLSRSPEFEKWVDRERERLERQYRESLDQLATAAEDAGRHDEAIRYWRELVGLDPFDSRAAARLMAVLDAAGNPAAALRVGREHARRLEAEFGAEPRPAVRQLEARIRAVRDEAVESTSPGRRLAVLPFDTVGAEPIEGFTDGVHGDLLNRLSGLGDVAVISRGSVMRYRGSERPADVIARELSSDWIVQGSVRAVEGRVRVDARLVNVRQDRQLWGEAYESDLTAADLFEAQGRIAGEIASALESRLTAAERREVRRTPTSDLDAHLLYVQGRGHLNERTEAGLRQAADYFQAAIDRDDRFALAWSGLADACGFLGFYGYAPPDAAPTPMEAARRALEIDGRCGEARASLGILHSLRQEGADARRELERAIALRPSHAEAYVWLGWIHLLAGRPQDALSSARRGVEIDPLAPAYHVYLAEIWLANGEDELALTHARRAGEIQPGYGLASFMQALVLHHQGRAEEASAALARMPDAMPPAGTPTRAEILALASMVRMKDDGGAGARDALAELSVESEAEPETAVCIGLLHAALGEHDAAFEALSRVRVWKDLGVEFLRYFFPEALGDLRADPRFSDLVQRMDRAWA